MELVPQRLLSAWPLGENGRPGLVVQGPAHVAVCSAYDVISWAGRAVYQGHRQRYRLALYAADDRQRVAVCDAARYPINDVAFHPTEPIVAVATGSYDGGYAYEGQLLVWNWRTNTVHDVLRESREITQCRFERDGRLAVPARPATDEDDGTFGAVSDDLRPAAGLELKRTSADVLGFGEQPAAYETSAAMHAELGLAYHAPILDLAWTADGLLAAACRDGRVELWSPHGAREHVIDVGDCVPQLLQHPERLLVHAVDERSRLFTLRGTRLEPWGPELADPYTCSIDARGRVLARGVRHLDLRRRDLVLSPTGALDAELDLGGYDVFNHFVRIDGQGDLYYLRGRGTKPHLAKVLASVDRAREVAWDTPQEHLMEGSATAVGDGAIVRACVVHHPRGAGAQRLERLALRDGAVAWRREVDAAAAALVAWPTIGAVAAALLDGTLHILDASTGDVLHADRFTIDGVPTIVTALAIHDESIALGTIDGRTAIAALR